MKDELKNVLLMGLGAISLTGEKANELKKELLEKGEVLSASNDYIYKAVMADCLLFKADMTHRITGISKDLILNTYYEENSEYAVSNAIEKHKKRRLKKGDKR